MAALCHVKAAAALAALLCIAAASHSSLLQVTRSLLALLSCCFDKRHNGTPRNVPAAAQVEDGSTARQRQAACSVSEEETNNTTFLLAAEIAEQCQDCCELRLRHLDIESSASAFFAGAPLLSVNTLTVQLPVKRGCSLALEAACAAGTSCQASGEVVLDDAVLLQQYAANADHSSDGSDSTSSAVNMLAQSIVVKHTAVDAASTPPAGNANQSMHFASMSIRQLVVSVMCVIAVSGLQGCLLHKLRRQEHANAD